MMTKRNTRFLVAMCSVMLLCGCGSTDAYSGSTASYDSGYAYGDEYYYEDADYALDSYEGTSLDESYATTAIGDNAATDVSDYSASKATGRKLITTVNMRVETLEFDALMDYLETQAEQLGGYVESVSVDQRTYSNQKERYSSITVRVPEASLQTYLSGVSERSNVTSESKSVEDVTLTYTDLESYKEALEAEEDQLLALMEKAETITDIMEIESQLTEVRYHLQSLESTLRTYDNLVSYSTVNISVEEVVEYTEDPEEELTFWEEAWEGFVDNLYDVGDFLRGVALFVIIHSPSIVLLLIIAILVIFFIRRAEKHSAKREAKRAEKREKKLAEAQKKREERMERDMARKAGKKETAQAPVKEAAQECATTGTATDETVVTEKESSQEES